MIFRRRIPHLELTLLVADDSGTLASEFKETASSDGMLKEFIEEVPMDTLPTIEEALARLRAIEARRHTRIEHLESDDIEPLVKFFTQVAGTDLPAAEIPCASSSGCPVDHNIVPIDCDACPLDPDRGAENVFTNLFLMLTPQGHAMVELRVRGQVDVSSSHLLAAVCNLLHVVDNRKCDSVGKHDED